MPGREDIIKMCQMIVGKKKKIPVFPFRVDMSPDCREGFKQFKTPIEFQRREENPEILIHTDAVHLSQGLPSRKSTGKWVLFNTKFSNRSSVGKWARVHGNGVKEKPCTPDQTKEKVWIEQDTGTKLQQTSRRAKAMLPNRNKQNWSTLKRKEPGVQRSDKTPALKENIIQSTKQNSSEGLCAMNQVNENMHSEKYELKMGW